MMSTQHNRWLQWKMDNGLAAKGRTEGVVLRPRNMLTRALARYFIKPMPAAPKAKRADMNEPGHRVFKQNVGGSVGSSGKVNM